MRKSELTCQELVELVTDYLEDALPAETRLRFDLHLAACPDCRAHVEQMRATIRLLGRADCESLPESLRRSLVAAFGGLRAR